MDRQKFRVVFEAGGYEGWPTAVRQDDASANLVSSIVEDPEEWPYPDEYGYAPTHSLATHAPALDLDVPARLVPSSTPGHSHLYIDVPMSWAKYLALLGALEDAGILEPGYVAASKRQGATFLRPPGVLKEAA